MLARLLPFELNLQLRQIGFWVTFAAMALIGFLIMSTEFVQVSGGGGERIKGNGAISLALLVSGLGLFSIFFGAIFVVSGMMRDETNKSLEMIHATPVPTRDLVMARMIGVFAATFLSMFALVIGLFAGQFAPWVDAETLGPPNPLYFLQPTLLYLAPNALFVSAFFILVAATTRNRTLVYVSAVGLFMVYTAGNLFVGEDAPDLILSLVDPFGSNALALTTEFWPADERNTTLSPLLGLIGLNRLVWGAVGLAALFFSIGMFRRGLVGGKTKDRRDDRASADTRPLSDITASPGRNPVQAFLRRTAFEYVTTVRSISFIILASLATALFALTVYVQAAFLPDPLLATNVQMAQAAIGSAFLPLLIIIVFFSGEIMWRDKTHGMVELVDASPVTNTVMTASKWLAMFGVIFTVLFAAMMVGIIAQLIFGDVPINLATHIQLSLLGVGPDLVLYAALILFLQNFMPNRILGMVIGGAIAMFFVFFVGLLPFFHPMMDYGSVPTGGFSEMNGIGNPLGARWFAIYWFGLALVFAVLTVWLWRRGMETGILTRLSRIGKRVTAATAGAGAIGLAGFAYAGTTIYSGFSDNDFQTRSEREAQQAEFERLLGDKIFAEVPKIRTVDAQVTLRPEDREAHAAGSYSFENVTGAPVEELYVSLPFLDEETVLALDIPGATRVTEGEIAAFLADTQLRLYRYAPALAPGATGTLSFEIAVPPPSLGGDGVIRNNGTFVNNQQIMPGLGVPDFRLRNPDRRRNAGLPELERLPDPSDQDARRFNFLSRSADYVDFSATVCTAPGQIPIAPGDLQRSYEQDGRACRDYRTTTPILNFFAFVSADYAVHEDVWQNPNGPDIPLAIWYHAPHDYNIDLMIEAMKQSFDTFTRLFGPYQYGDVRIMEFPYQNFAQSFAATIPFSENIGFMRNPGDPEDPESVDLATYVTLHEIGHQWFAHQVVPAQTKGFNILSEGLTENAALTAYEEALGWQKARRLLEQRAIQQYLIGRTTEADTEPPLALAEGQQYLDYNKASWVFWGLKQYIGKDEMQTAIRGFLEEYGSKGPPYPTTNELVAALREAAGPDYQQLITDYWNRIVFWELSLGEDAVTITPQGAGFEATVTVKLDKKIASEETGKEASVTEIDGEDLNEWVEIGFYAEDPEETLGDGWQALERVRLTEAETTLTFELDEKPAFVLLDPRRLLIERNVDDNVTSLPD